MIKSFRHKGVEKFFRTNSRAGIQPHHAKRLALQLGALDVILTVDEMDVPGWHLHPLKGELEGHWAVTVNGNWRLTFMFEAHDVFVVDYQDYH
jgi:proteic killer suppression protein